MQMKSLRVEDVDVQVSCAQILAESEPVSYKIFSETLKEAMRKMHENIKISLDATNTLLSGLDERLSALERKAAAAG